MQIGPADRRLAEGGAGCSSSIIGKWQHFPPPARPFHGTECRSAGLSAPPLKGGLLDHEPAFRLAESARKRYSSDFSSYRVAWTQTFLAKEKGTPGLKRCAFSLSTSSCFFSVLEAHRLTLPHGLVARRPEKMVFTGCVSRTHFPRGACMCDKPEGQVGALPVLRVHIASMTLLIPARNLNNMGFFLLTASQLPPCAGHFRFPRPL